MLQASTKRIDFSRTIQWVAALTTAGAGIVHLALGLQQAHSAAHSLFFIAAGAAQCLLAIAILLRATQPMLQAGLMLNAVLIALWMLTRLLPAPFESGPEAVDLPGLATQLLQAGALTTLLIAITTDAGLKARRQAVALLLLALLAAAGTYSIAMAAERSLPQLVVHQHGQTHTEEQSGHSH